MSASNSQKADTLATACENVHAEYKRIFEAIGLLRATMDVTAERVAKENADWHDDPDADDHAEFHAPAIEQFPREVRDEAILDLVKHYLAGEMLDVV